MKLHQTNEAPAMLTADPLDIVLAYRTSSSVEAHSLTARLAEADVEAQIVGEFLGGAYAGINFGRMGDKEVWVKTKDAAVAKTLIAQWEAEHTSRNVEPSRRLPLAVHLAYILA